MPADLNVVGSNNLESGYCAAFNPVGAKINYGQKFINTAKAKEDVAQEEAAHEIGHTLGLQEAYPSPGTATIMN